MKLTITTLMISQTLMNTSPDDLKALKSPVPLGPDEEYCWIRPVSNERTRLTFEEYCTDEVAQKNENPPTVK